MDCLDAPEQVDLSPTATPTGSLVVQPETEIEMLRISRTGRHSGMRILVAHNVPSARTGGMSRMMGFIHDRMVVDGHIVEFFNTDNAPGYARGMWEPIRVPLGGLSVCAQCAPPGRWIRSDQCSRAGRRSRIGTQRTARPSRHRHHVPWRRAAGLGTRPGRTPAWASRTGLEVAVGVTDDQTLAIPAGLALGRSYLLFEHGRPGTT